MTRKQQKIQDDLIDRAFAILNELAVPVAVSSKSLRTSRDSTSIHTVEARAPVTVPVP